MKRSSQLPGAPRPPRLADALLELCYNACEVEEIQGDLYELFERRVAESGVRPARRKYWLDVLRFLVPFSGKRRIALPQPAFPASPLSFFAMLRNYLTVAGRNLRRNALYAGLNVFGLAAGTMCVLLALLFVQDELSYDRFHRNGPRLYRVTTTYTDTGDGSVTTAGGTGMVQGPAFKAQIPEIEKFVRLMSISTNVKAGGKANQLRVQFADSTFFDVFSFGLRHGDARTALRGPHVAVLTEETARRYFGTTDVVGRTVEVEEARGKPFQSFLVTAVARQPVHSSIQFDLLLPFGYMQSLFNDTNWLNAYLGTFVVLHPGADAGAVAGKLGAVFRAHAGDQLVQAQRERDFRKQIRYGLQPVTDIHFNTYLEGHQGSNESGVFDGSKPLFSFAFGGIAVFILLMACVNFINLSIAGSLGRAKEIGIRKISGSSRRQIVLRFLLEAALLCLAAFALALLGTQLALPVFNELTGKQLALLTLPDARLVAAGVLLLVVNVCLAGLYPAVLVSGFNPARVLYHQPRAVGRYTLGKALVVFQFSLAVGLLFATLVYYRQMRFIRTKDLGYNPAEVVQVELPPRRIKPELLAYFAQELGKHASIRAVAHGNGGFYNDMKAGDRTLRSHYRVVNAAYLPLMEIPLVQGRNVDPAFAGDKTHGALVNESFVRAAGWKNPLGQTFRNHDDEDRPLTVVGVVKDHHYGSLHERIGPQVLTLITDDRGSLLVKLAPGQRQKALAVLEQTYKKAIPDAPYAYQFLDAANAGQYGQELKWQRTVHLALGLAILICCLGLFGMAHLLAGQRTREIGVRKVLGATVPGLAVLLARDFLKPVLLAVAIASPLAGWAAERWLQGFAYRVSIPAWTFGATAVLSVTIALATVGFQSVKAALTNPVDALRRD